MRAHFPRFSQSAKPKVANVNEQTGVIRVRADGEVSDALRVDRHTRRRRRPGYCTTATDIAAADPNVWTIRNIGDYNGDGRDDILWQHDNGLVYVWLMNGASIQSAGALAGIGSDWSVIG